MARPFGQEFTTLAPTVPAEPIAGLYEKLLTVELERLLASLESGRASLSAAEPADAHLAVADHLRRIIARALQ